MAVKGKLAHCIFLFFSLVHFGGPYILHKF